MVRFRLAIIVALVVGFAAPAATGGDADRRGLFQELCGRCHARAGVLASERLTARDGVLRSRNTGADMREFLARHYGRPSPADIAFLYARLSDILAGRGLFPRKCGICHGTAEALARAQLVIRDGKLMGRYSGHAVDQFLIGHGRLDEAGAAFFAGVLKRAARAARH